METTDKTTLLFQLTAPYKNPYQGTDKKLLFVCSAGLLRSATGANLYAKKGYNTRNAGTHEYALIPLSANLIAWADHIFFVNEENAIVAERTFHGTSLVEPLVIKRVILNIPDNYCYNDPELLKIFEEQMPSL